MKIDFEKVLMYDVCNIKFEEIQMNTIIALLKDIFSFDCGNEKVGLSQFNRRGAKRISEQNVLSRPKELKLSDLMRKSY
jgi:hypothetical protein